MVFNTSIGFIIFNAVGFIYLFSQDKLSRFEFYIMYGLNIFYFILVLLYLGYNTGTDLKDCDTVIIFRFTVLFILIKRELEIGFLMWK